MQKNDVKSVLKKLVPYGYAKKHFESQPNFNNTWARQSPEFYNADGQKMDVYYLQDRMSAPAYSLVYGRFPRQIFWDRYHKGLPIHFYTHDDMKQTSDLCEKKYGFLRESEAIIPQMYEWALANPSRILEFDAIFTHSAKILDRFSNAVFAPPNGVWYGTKPNGGNLLDSENYRKKTKNISMVSSNKAMCEGHRQRITIARHYAETQMVDVYGTVCGNYVEKKADALQPYRYSIAVENDKTPYYFTEKILDCFAAMTIPIYVGATRIDEFFNPDGIIKMDTWSLEEWDKVITRCGTTDYEERLEAVKDNYQRVFEYLCIEDYITDHYEIGRV